MKKFLILILVFFLHNISLAETIEYNKNTSKDFITKAKSANAKAKKLKNEWRQPRKLIKKASAAHKNKDYKKSIKLAKEALNQALMSIEQHNSQKEYYRFFE